MAAAGETKLFIAMSPLSPTFAGTPQEFAEHLVARLKILSPFGIETFVVGDTAPDSNEGPWLKNGRTWYVWDETTSTYVPADITDSSTAEIVVSTTKPTTFGVPIWAEFSGSGVNTRFVRLHLSTGTDYTPLVSSTNSGTTAERPGSPVDFEQFYDTDIQCLIWWERFAWRTVSGVPGDVKHVLGSTLTDILTNNPGWQEIGSVNSSFRGRTVVAATKDSSGGTTFPPNPGISPRSTGDVVGEETHTLTVPEMPSHTHEIKVISTSGSGTTRVEKSKNNTAPTDSSDTESAGNSTAHNNMQPSFVLWCIYKQ